jgi:plastocyanin
MRRALAPFALVACAALLCGLAGSVSASAAPGAKRSGGAACAALKKKQARKRCTHPRAAFKYVAGRGVARVAAGEGLARPSGGGPAAGTAAAVGGAAPSAPGSPTDAVQALVPAPPLLPIVTSTVGVEAHDIGSFVLRLTRTAVPAGKLTIYFRNQDSSLHNLWLAPSQGTGGQAVLISDDVGEGGGATRTVTVTPGGWRLFCSISGHNSMTRDLAVG